MTAALSVLAQNWLGIIIGIALAALVAFVWLIPSAREEGRSLERAAALQKSMDLIKERGKTNAEIGKLDDAGLCAALDGRWVLDHCE